MQVREERVREEPSEKRMKDGERREAQTRGGATREAERPRNKARAGLSCPQKSRCETPSEGSGGPRSTAKSVHGVWG